MPPSTSWREEIPAGEPEKLERFAEQLRELQRKNARHGSTRRALHAKAHVAAKAELTVLPDVPDYARIGLFSEPKTYRAYVRFSNGAGVNRKDAGPDQRGIAIKVLGVPGKKIIPGLENATTQDFLLIKSRVTPFKDATDFVWFVTAASKPATLLPRAIFHYGPGLALKLIRATLKDLSAKTSSLATSPLYSALPIKFGPYAVKYQLQPHAKPDDGQQRGGRDFLADDLVERLQKGPLSWDFRVQFFVDEQRTPIEDASVEWKESDAPFVTLARLTLPQQDVRGEAGAKLAERLESYSFDPWHATEDFRPLGAMMRARNAAYRLSTIERRAAPEPDGSEWT